MFIDPLIEIILQFWTNPPAQISQEWQAVKEDLAVYLARYDEAATVEARQRIVLELEDWLEEEAPDLFSYLERSTEAKQSMKGIAEPSSRNFYATMMAAICAALAREPAASAAPVKRYTDIRLPRRVQVGERFAVIVGLSMLPTPDSAATAAISATPGQRVRVVLSPGVGLEILGDRMRELRVEAERDSDPAVFYLRAVSPGRYKLNIEYWLEGQLVAESPHSLEAVDAPVVESWMQPAGQAIIAGSPAPAYPDLVIRITTKENQLHYDLHFGDVRFLSVPGERLCSDPETYRYELIRRMEAIAREVRNRKADPAELQAALEQEGRLLYRELFSAEMRRQYRNFWRTVKTLQIISDEPWLPWELIKPYDDDGDEVLDHDFLCVQFELTRWLGPGAPAAQIPIAGLAAIVPGDSKLTAAQGERHNLVELAQTQGAADLSPATATRQAVLEKLSGSERAIQLWHFACHGNFQADQANRAPLLLENKTTLIPDDLNGRVQTALKHTRPLVTLNACRVGQSGLSLTGMGGWAKVLVQDCHVGALLAPMWEISDDLAREFAAAFYRATVGTPGSTLAQAVRAARQHIRGLRPHDPTWLAYALYAHPNARLVWETGENA